MSECMTELGFPVPVAGSKLEALEVQMRGVYDVSRLRRLHPQLVSLVEFLLSIPGMEWDVIADRAGMAWESVAAIAKDQAGAIREFKVRNAASIGVCIEAAGPVMLQRIRDGKIDAIQLKVLVDAWLLLNDQATVRVEHTRALSPEEEALRQFMSQVTFTGVPGMGLEAGKTPAMGPVLDAVEVGAVGSVALTQPLTLNALQRDTASLVSKDPQSPVNFDQGGEGVGDPPPASS